MAESTIVEYSTEYTIANFSSLRALVFSRMCVARWLLGPYLVLLPLH